jgi:hypothetical protein
MLRTRGVQAEKVLVLSEEHSSLSSRTLQVLFVPRAKQPGFRCGKHIGAALPQTADHRPGDVLVRVKSNSL